MQYVFRTIERFNRQTGKRTSRFSQNSIFLLRENFALSQINLLKTGGTLTLDSKVHHKTLTSNVVRSQRLYTPSTDSITSLCVRHTRYANPCLPTQKHHP